MTNTDRPAGKVHHGRNIKRFRDMLGIKQEALALELGDDWSQKKVSRLEENERVEEDVLEQVANFLAHRSAAGLSQDFYGAPSCTEAVRQQADLRGFAAAFRTFEGEQETGGGGWGGHVGSGRWRGERQGTDVLA